MSLIYPTTSPQLLERNKAEKKETAYDVESTWIAEQCVMPSSQITGSVLYDGMRNKIFVCSYQHIINPNNLQTEL